MSHQCPGPGCTRQVERLMCLPHWDKVPADLRRAYYATVGTPEHAAVERAAIESVGGKP